jgi:hypothetical protein
MFTRELRCWAPSVALVLLAGAVTLWLQMPPDPINQSSADRIRLGMGIDEVNEILGVKTKGHVVDPCYGYAIYKGIRGTITVPLREPFSENSTVSGPASFRAMDPGLLDLLRAWLGW